jgi:HK97 family phage major capsid protein
MFSDDFIQGQNERKLRAWEAMKSIADRAKSDADLSSEDRSAYDAAESDFNAAKSEVERAVRMSELSKAQVEERRPAFVTEARDEAPAVHSDAEIIRALAFGEQRSATFEKRVITTGSTGAPVPTSFYDQLVEHLVVQGPMLDPAVTNIITTAGGENFQFPRTSSYTAGAITAQGSAISASEPAFGSLVTLGSFKYAALIQVSSEMIADSGITDLLGFIARQAATGVGTAVNAGLTTGTGTTQPTGIVTAASSAVTGGTGVAGAPTGDNLLDLVYSVASPYRRRGASFQMNATTLAGVRKLKDTTNQYLWQPSVQAGQPDTLLGFPVYENPDVASAATGARSVIFGDASCYFVRQVGGITLARSDEYAFNTDLVTFRVTWRGDGNLIDTAGVKYYKGAAT